MLIGGQDSAFSQQANISVIDSISKAYFNLLAIDLNEKQVKKVTLAINDSAVGSFFGEIAVRQLDSSGIRITLDTTSILKISVVDVATRYENTSSSDSLERVITIKIRSSLQLDNSKSPLEILDVRYTDRISRQSVNMLNSRIYPFASAKPPMPDLSFWEKYLEPAIITTAAVLTVWLFFSVRSN